MIKIRNYFCTKKENNKLFFLFQTNIVQLNELFQDVNKMIHEHGEIIGKLFKEYQRNIEKLVCLDAIDGHIVDVEKDVVVATTQLEQAVRDRVSY